MQYKTRQIGETATKKRSEEENTWERNGPRKRQGNPRRKKEGTTRQGKERKRSGN